MNVPYPTLTFIFTLRSATCDVNAALAGPREPNGPGGAGGSGNRGDPGSGSGGSNQGMPTTSDGVKREPGQGCAQGAGAGGGGSNQLHNGAGNDETMFTKPPPRDGMTMQEYYEAEEILKLR